MSEQAKPGTPETPGDAGSVAGNTTPDNSELIAQKAKLEADVEALKSQLAAANRKITEQSTTIKTQEGKTKTVEERFIASEKREFCRTHGITSQAFIDSIMDRPGDVSSVQDLVLKQAEQEKQAQEENRRLQAELDELKKLHAVNGAYPKKGSSDQSMDISKMSLTERMLLAQQKPELLGVILNHAKTPN